MLAAAIDCDSEHPLAESIVRGAKEKKHPVYKNGKF